jgi:hypothetical protein
MSKRKEVLWNMSKYAEKNFIQFGRFVIWKSIFRFERRNMHFYIHIISSLDVSEYARVSFVKSTD